MHLLVFVQSREVLTKSQPVVEFEDIPFPQTSPIQLHWAAPIACKTKVLATLNAVNSRMQNAVQEQWGESREMTSYRRQRC